MDFRGFSLLVFNKQIEHIGLNLMAVDLEIDRSFLVYLNVFLPEVNKNGLQAEILNTQ